MRARSLLLPLVLLLCSQPAMAAVPDPSHSAVDACLIVCPEGDFTFHVTVRDIVGSPIANSTVQVNLCTCPSVIPCPGEGCSYLQQTDAAGNATFQIKAGGTCLGGVLITADGVLLGSRGVASPDQNGDLIVDAADYAVAVGKVGLPDITADFDCDLLVTNADLNVVYTHAGHSCQPVPALQQSWGRMKAIYR